MASREWLCVWVCVCFLLTSRRNAMCVCGKYWWSYNICISHLPSHRSALNGEYDSVLFLRSFSGRRVFSGSTIAQAQIENEKHIVVVEWIVPAARDIDFMAEPCAHKGQQSIIPMFVNRIRRHFANCIEIATNKTRFPFTIFPFIDSPLRSVRTTDVRLHPSMKS